MIPEPFRYVCPDSLEEASRLLADAVGDAVVLGGGTMLLPHMGRGEVRPTLIVDPRRLGLRHIRKEDRQIVIGARATYEDIATSPLLTGYLRLLPLMTAGVTGGRSITGQGTIGGSACYANPASDAPACLVALGARFRLQSLAGVREVPAASFFTGAFQTAMTRDEFLTEMVFVGPDQETRVGYYKLKFSGSSWPIVTAACCLRINGPSPSCVAVGAAAPAPVLVSFQAEDSASDRVDELVVRLLAQIPSAWADELADGAYRRAVVPEVVRRAFTMAE